MMISKGKSIFCCASRDDEIVGTEKIELQVTLSTKSIASSYSVRCHKSTSSGLQLQRLQQLQSQGSSFE